MKANTPLLRVPRLIARAVAVTVTDYARMIVASSQSALTSFSRAGVRPPAGVGIPPDPSGHLAATSFLLWEAAAVIEGRPGLVAALRDRAAQLSAVDD